MTRTGRTRNESNEAATSIHYFRTVCTLVKYRYHLLIMYAPADKKVRFWMGRQRSLKAEFLRTLMPD